MTNQKILDRLAPCGLHCGKCFAFTQGSVKTHSKGLEEALGDFDAYAERFVDLLNEPGFSKYPQFKEVLSCLNQISCKGCRADDCRLFEACRVKSCYKEQQVDFCFECEKFPCTQTGFDDHLYDRWEKINIRMKTIGVENYYSEIKDVNRY
ncbi:MAG: DUF3795 domain-containing protein [Bacteroidales bacterium]|nr:DUF3795 domain-containing protein [Bacteroidales bacterium]